MPVVLIVGRVKWKRDLYRAEQDLTVLDKSQFNHSLMADRGILMCLRMVI